MIERQASLLILCLLSGLGVALGEDNLAEKISAEVRRVFDERHAAVVRIEAVDRHGKLVGTGFYADPSGSVYTLASTVANADEIYIVQGDRKMPAKLLVADMRSGVALIKPESGGSSPFIPLGSSKSLGVASPVMTIGYPINLDASPSFGIIGGVDYQFLGHFFMTSHIRANVPVEAGFGGAPLLNLKGEVVGIIIAGLGRGGACYALPIEAAEKIRHDFVRFGEPRHGWVGVNVKEQDTEVGGSHVSIAELAPETPAGQSDLKPGDVVTQIGDHKINHIEDVIDASFFLTAGDKVTVSVMRGGEKKDITLRSVEHPNADASKFPETGDLDLHALVPTLAPNSSPATLKLE